MTSKSSMPTPVALQDLRQTLARHDQSHLLRFWDELDEDHRQKLFSDLTSIDFEEVQRNVDESKTNLASLRAVKLESKKLEPVPDEGRGAVRQCSADELEAYRRRGLAAISSGRVGVILLAGGQGTRLGSADPKGMFDVGLPSGKSLYQIQAERLLTLKRLAKDKDGNLPSVPWYIMTSPTTREPTASFFARHAHFGLPGEDVVIFEQGTLPCVDFEGRIILEEGHRVSRAPDGNGGLYRALSTSGVMSDISSRGIEFLHVYCVDNILVKLGDPTFLGFCVSKDADCGAKVVEKTQPHESVGVVCRVDGRFQVVEYSEISSADAERRREDGKLVFNAGSICNHFFQTEFLRRVVETLSPKMPFHVARKKIPHVDPSSGLKVKPLKPNGIKLEKFVFDVFAFAQNFVCWEVGRSQEFSPLKNADDCAKDTPTTCRQDLFRLHRSYVEAAGGEIFDANQNKIVDKETGSGEINGHCETNGHCEKNGLYENNEKLPVINGYSIVDQFKNSCQINEPLVCEISPLITYDGEGLEKYVLDKKFEAPVLIYDEALDTLIKS